MSTECPTKLPKLLSLKLESKSLMYFSTGNVTWSASIKHNCHQILLWKSLQVEQVRCARYHRTRPNDDTSGFQTACHLVHFLTAKLLCTTLRTIYSLFKSSLTDSTFQNLVSGYKQLFFQLREPGITTDSERTLNYASALTYCSSYASLWSSTFHIYCHMT